MGFELLKEIVENPIPFAHALGMTKLTEQLHKDWIKTMFSLSSNGTLQAHRGSYKTTCLRVAIDLRMIAKPESNLILQRKSDGDVKDMINAVSKDLKSDICMNLMNDIYGEFPKFVADNNSEIELSTYRGVMGRQLIGLGIGSSITGKHGYVVTDDIVTLKDRISAAERERTKSQVMELVNIASEENMHVYNCGTPWHKDDAFTLMPDPLKYTWKDTGIISPGRAEEIRASMSPSLFAANYDLKHIADGDILFKEPKYGKFPEGLKCYAHIDAAFGGADATALTIMGIDGDKYYTCGWKMGGHIENHYVEIISKLERFCVLVCHLENNADKGFVKRDLEKRTHIIFDDYHEKMNKYYKITTYGKNAWNNAIIDIDESDQEYIGEIMDFNENSAHDDCPDSFSSLAREYCDGYAPIGRW